jgi:thiamine-phosphate pyrophosphorylase
MSLRLSHKKTGLYLITADDSDSRGFLTRVCAVLNDKIAVLQYRNKLATESEKREQAETLLKECRRLGIIFIINDDIALAKSIQADGVHLGEHDGDIQNARWQLGDTAIIGASCYNSLALAEKATADGADYIAFGAIYPSATKPHARQAGLELFQQAAHLNIPMVAIGGITPDNAAATIAAGANFIAVIGAVFDAADPLAEVNKFISHF